MIMENEEDKLEQEEKEYQQDIKDGFYQPDQHPESDGEGLRKGFIGYAGVLALVGSILLFLGIGWAADLAFASNPWGITSGIIFGWILGFYQFIRLSAKLNY